METPRDKCTIRYIHHREPQRVIPRTMFLTIDDCNSNTTMSILFFMDTWSLGTCKRERDDSHIRRSFIGFNHILNEGLQQSEIKVVKHRLSKGL